MTPMCVIIERPAETKIPFDKLKAACERNGDGFGVLILDRNKFEVVHNYDPKGNDPEKVAKILEDAAKQPVYVHLRHQTRGPKNTENCHPFQVFGSKKNTGIHFMHNGTISGFGNANQSDSYEFAERVIKPYLERFATSKSAENIETLLKDDLLILLLEQFAGQGSKFVLVDEKGFCLKINESQGKTITFDDKDPKHSTIWASNDYSFYTPAPYKDTSQRQVFKHTPNGGGTQNRGVTFPDNSGSKPDWESSLNKQVRSSQGSAETQGDFSWKNRWSSDVHKDDNAGSNQSNSVLLPDSEPGTEPTSKIAQEILTEGGETCEVSDLSSTIGNDKIVYDPNGDPNTRLTFIELFGITSWEEITKFTHDDFKEFIADIPDAMAILLCDLRDMLFWKQRAGILITGDAEKKSLERNKVIELIDDESDTTRVVEATNG